MQLTELRSDTRKMISRQLTSTDYSDADLDANLNLWYQRILGWILAIQGDWEINGDIIYRDFMPGVTKYELPKTLIRLYKGEVMYEVAGTFVPLTFKSEQANQNIAEGNETRPQDDPNHPTAELYGDKIEIRPCIDVTGVKVENGIKLWVQTDFTVLDTTNDVPNLITAIQRALCMGAAMDYAKGEEMWTKYGLIKKELFGDPNVKEDEGVKGEIENIYSVRQGARRDTMAARRKSFK